MGAPRKCPAGLRGRATRMAVQARRDPDGSRGRVADEPGVHPEAGPGQEGRDRRRWEGRDHHGRCPGRIRALEAGNRGLGRADEILRKTSACSGPGGARPPVGVIDSSIHDSRADPRGLADPGR